MDAIADVTYRIYPATAMIAAGVVMAFFGLRRDLAGLRAPFSDRNKTLNMLTGFRMAIVGIALMLFGAAWIAQVTWLMWLAAIIGLGELLESSLMISGIRTGQQLADEQQRRNHRTS
ncbi:MAG: hypothetical protein WEB52_06170 [Dehalococcoidia bacterium]